MRRGPDPAIGGTLALLGIVLMGITGASDMNYAFNAATGVAMLGAAAFVGAVGITSWRDGRAAKEKK